MLLAKVITGHSRGSDVITKQFCHELENIANSDSNSAFLKTSIRFWRAALWFNFNHGAAGL